MRIILFIFGMLLSGQVGASSTSGPKEIVFVGHDVEPYYFRSGSPGVQGAYFDLLTEACKARKWQCKFKLSAFRASLEMLQSGRADAGGPMAATEQRRAVYLFSQPLFITGYCFFASPKNYQSKMSYPDLIGKTVGVFGPSATELSLQRVNEVVNQKIKFTMEPDYNTSLRKAESNTYNFAYANCDTGRHWIERNRSTLKEVPALGEKSIYHIVFSRKTFTEQDLKEFNSTLDTLRGSGYLEKLAEKYKIKLAPLEK